MSPYSHVPFAWRYALLLAATHSETPGTLPAGRSSGLLSWLENKGGNNEKRQRSRFSDVISLYRLAFKTVTYQLKELLIYWAMQKLAQLPETQKPPEQFSCGSSTGCWLCSCAAEAQLGILRILRHSCIFFQFSVVSVIIRPFTN